MWWSINFGGGSSMMSTSTGDFYAGKFLSYHWRSIISRRVPIFNNLGSKGMLRDVNPNGNSSLTSMVYLSQQVDHLQLRVQYCGSVASSFASQAYSLSSKHDLFCMATFGMQPRGHVSSSIFSNPL